MSLTVTDLGLPPRIEGRIAIGSVPADPSRPVEGPCWEWQGDTYPSGYGRCWLNGENRGVHQVAYEATTGIRSDRERFVDHICRNRACCNPDHLELVTPLGNQLSAQRAHCKNGHEFTPENTYRMAHKPTQRLCRACAREKTRRYRERKANQC